MKLEKSRYQNWRYPISIQTGRTVNRQWGYRYQKQTMILGLLIGAIFGLPEAGATIAPEPDTGHDFPQSYHELRKKEPEKFKVDGGLRSKVERAKKYRQQWLQEKQKSKSDGNTSSLSDLGASAAAATMPAEAVVTGSFNIPVILVSYQNVDGAYDFKTLQTVLFGSNPTGNLTQYYQEVSYGNITVTGTVYDWVTLPQDDTYYEGASNGLDPTAATNPAKTGALIKSALDAQDGTIDFGQFDNDGPDGIPNSGDDDGFVDFIAFVHPEIGGECGTTGGANIWSHRWNYRFWPNANSQPYTTNDARSGGGFIQIDDYVIQPARNCSGNTIEIGVFAHEFGHAFGIPDLYDTDSNASQGLGHWSLMAAGNWRTPSLPAHWDAWSKSQLGWLVPTLLTSQANGVQISRVEDTAKAIQIPIGNGRYFLIENRQKFGFDQNLWNCGLLIYEIDELLVTRKVANNSVNAVQNCGPYQQNSPDHYGVALKQADGLCNLEANTNRGDAGDSYPGSTTNRTFNSTSNPSVIDYDGNNTQVSVANISNCGVVMTADIQAFPLPGFPPGAVDIVFLIDVTGSYIDDLPTIKAQMPGIVSRLSSAFPDIRFGLATFRDFPFDDFGMSDDFAYNPALPLQGNSGIFLNAVNALVAAQGLDLPEAQYEAIYQVLTGAGRDLTGDGDTNDPGEIAPSSIGWTTGRSRVLYLLTDASFHNSDIEDYPGTLLKAAGRNAVRALLQPNNPLIFTMVAENPGVVVTQGETGNSPPISRTELTRQAEELASDTLGGVFAAGSNSGELSAAIDVTVTSLKEGSRPIGRITIDVKPGSTDNPVNLNESVLPVAILGSATFNVGTIDKATLRFGPSDAAPTSAVSISDVNDDGYADLVLHFKTSGTGIKAGDTEACLSAQTNDKVLLVGCDVIRTVPSK